jgi:hypothetical protein
MACVKKDTIWKDVGRLIHALFIAQSNTVKLSDRWTAGLQLYLDDSIYSRSGQRELLLHT